MRIAYVLLDPGIGIFGTKGASIHAQEMIRAFMTMGHQVEVFCLKRGNSARDPESETVPQDLAHLPVTVLPAPGGKDSAARERAVYRSSDRVSELLTAGDFDLIYERYSLFSTAGARAVTRAGAHTTAQAMTAAGAATPAGSPAAPRVGPGLVVEVNSPLVSEQSMYRSLHDTAGALAATKETLTQADVVSCVSQPVADWVAEVTDTASGVVVIPNGVDVTRFPDPTTDTTAAAGDSVFRVGFVGTLKPWHGTETLVRAFAAASSSNDLDWQLDIVGDGPERVSLEETARECGVGHRTTFHGAQAPARVPAIMSTWDVAVAPYPAAAGQGHYFSPLKIYEYMAAGLPTLTTDVGDLRTLIRHELTGVVVEPSSVEALAQGLRWLAADPLRRQELGERARQEAAESHTWHSRATAVLKQFHAVSARAELMRTEQMRSEREAMLS